MPKHKRHVTYYVHDMKKESKRLKTFSRNWPHKFLLPQELAKAGFYFVGDDVVRCAFCKIQIGRWESRDIPRKEHRRWAPNCPFVRDVPCGNVPMQVGECYSSSSDDKMSVDDDQLSFDVSGIHEELRPFSYNDVAQLSFNVFRHDQEWRPFYETMKEAPRTLAPMLPTNQRVKVRNVTSEELDSLMASDAALMALEVGFDAGSVRNILQRKIEETGILFSSPDDLVLVLLSSQTEETRNIGTAHESEGSEEEHVHSNKENEGDSGNQASEASGQGSSSGSWGREDKRIMPNHKGHATYHEEDMKRESKRLKTFTPNWPHNFVHPKDLAKAGFYFLRDDVVRCAFCEIELDRWESGDMPRKEHRRWAPNCPFVRDLPCGNVPMQVGECYSSSSDDKMSVDDDQLSFDACRHDQEWRPFYETMKEAPRTLAPMLPTNQRVKVRNVTSEELDSLMASDAALMALEVGFDAGSVRNILQRKIEETGIPFSSPDDLVLVLLSSQTEETRNIGTAHESEGSEEEHVHRELSHPFEEPQVQVDSLRTRITGNEVSLLEQGLNEECTGANNITAESENVISSGENGACSIPRMDSLSCASGETVEVGSNTNGVSKLASQGERTTALEENRASPNSASLLAALEEENRRYRESQLCKVCLDNEVGVVFLPCGHLVSCVHCAPILNDCPVCRRSIGACARAYLS